MSQENLQVAEVFIDNGWRETSPPRRVEEIISNRNETHRITDPYTFYLDEKGFYMLDEDGEKTYAKDTMETTSRIGKIEGEILDNLQMWFKNNQMGRILWFSPPSPGRYPDWKLITHEIKRGETYGKTLHNRVDIFGSSTNEVVQLIHDFFPETSEIDDPENIRPHLFLVEDGFNLETLFGRIKQIDPRSFAKDGGLSKEELVARATYISDLIDRGIEASFIAHEMQRLGLLGKHSTSCPPSFSELLSGVSLGSDEYGSLEFSCPSCGGTNTRPFGTLISNCQHCGANVRC